MSSSGYSPTIVPIPLILTDEVLRRLEAVPGQQGPALRVRLSRTLLARAAEVVLLLPAPLEELHNARVTVSIDLAQDRDWLPLLTYLIPSAESTRPGVALNEAVIQGAISALVNMRESKTEAERRVRAAYQPGDDLQKLISRALRTR